MRRLRSNPPRTVPGISPVDDAKQSRAIAERAKRGTGVWGRYFQEIQRPNQIRHLPHWQHLVGGNNATLTDCVCVHARPRMTRCSKLVASSDGIHRFGVACFGADVIACKRAGGGVRARPSVQGTTGGCETERQHWPVISPNSLQFKPTLAAFPAPVLAVLYRDW